MYDRLNRHLFNLIFLIKFIQTYYFTILHQKTHRWYGTAGCVIMHHLNLPYSFRTYGRLSHHLLFQLAVAVNQLLLTKWCSTPSRLHLSKRALRPVASVLKLRALVHFKLEAALGVLKIVPGTNETSFKLSVWLPQTTLLCWQMLQLLLDRSVSSGSQTIIINYVKWMPPSHMYVWTVWVNRAWQTFLEGSDLWLIYKKAIL